MRLAIKEMCSILRKGCDVWQRVLGFRIRKSGFKEAQITLIQYQVHYLHSFPSPINPWIKEIISLIGSKLKFFTEGRWASLGYLHPRTGYRSWLQDHSTSNFSYSTLLIPCSRFLVQVTRTQVEIWSCWIKHCSIWRQWKMRTTSGGHYLPESSPKAGLQLHSVKTLGKELGIALSLDGVLKGLVLENILQFLALSRPHVRIHKIYQILTKC